MPTDLERQVAEAVDENGDLRWVPLSRECPGAHNWNWERLRVTKDSKLRCFSCHRTILESSGRMPDVTLEKVLPILKVGKQRQIRFTYAADGIIRCVVSDNPGRMFIGEGTDERDAACGALLASVKA